MWVGTKSKEPVSPCMIKISQLEELTMKIFIIKKYILPTNIYEFLLSCNRIVFKMCIVLQIIL